MNGRIGLALSQAVFASDPGGPPLAATLEVSNQGRVVDRFLLRVDKLDPSWYRLSDSILGLWPDERATIRLELSVPADAAAGEYPFEVTATSGDAPGESTTVPATLHVGAVGALELVVTPGYRQAFRSARFAVSLRNLGNAERLIRLEPTGAALSFRFEPEVVAVGAGGTASGMLVVRASGTPLVGIARELAFTLAALPAEDGTASPLATAQGILKQTPPLAPLAGGMRRVRMVVPAAIGLLLALAGLLWLLGAPGLQSPARLAGPASPPPLTTPTGAEQHTPPLAPAAQAPAGPPVAAPRIVHFGLLAGAGQPPPRLPLSWEVLGATDTRLERQGDVGPRRGFEPVEMTHYTLVASNAGGITYQSIDLYVLRPPVIQSFFAEAVQVGDRIRLSWRTDRATRVYLNDELLPTGEGTTDVPLDVSRPYVLRAENAAGVDRRELTVQPLEQPFEPEPSVSATSSPTPGALEEPTIQPSPTAAPVPTPETAGVSVAPTSVPPVVLSTPRRLVPATPIPVAPATQIAPTTVVTAVPLMTPATSVPTTPCPILTAQLQTRVVAGSVEVRWSVTGGCGEPYTGVIHVDNTYRSQQHDVSIAGASGTVSDAAPPPGCGTGSIVYTLDARDGAHHSANASATVDVAGPACAQIENLPPVTTVTLDPPPNASGWYATAPLPESVEPAFPARQPVIVTVHLTATDPDSGVEKIIYVLNGPIVTADTVSGAAANIALSAGGSWTPEGTYTLTFHAVDKEGNIESDHTLPISVDNTPPTITAQVTTADGQPYAPGTWTNQDVSLLWTCSDAAGASGATASGFAPGACPAQQILPLPGQETYTPRGVVQDQAGNWAYGTFGQIAIDKIAPTSSGSAESESVSNVPYATTTYATTYETTSTTVVSSTTMTLTTTTTSLVTTTAPVTTTTTTLGSSQPYADGTWTRGAVRVTLNASDSPSSGVKEIAYSMVHDGVQGDSGTFAGTTGSLDVADDGTTILTYFARDRAGNVESPHTFTVRVDRVAPTTQAVPDVPIPPGPTTFFVNQPITLSLQASDNPGGGGVASTYYRVGDDDYACYADPHACNVYHQPIRFAEDGRYTLRYYSVDAAGNQETPREFTVAIDMTPPSTTATVGLWHWQGYFNGLPPYASGWYGAYSWGEDGYPAVRLTPSDAGGSGLRQLEYQASGAPMTCNPACAATATGDTDTIIVLRDSQNEYLPEGVVTVTYHAVDGAGNVEPTRSVTIPIDLTAPLVTANATTADGQPYYANTWTNQPVTVSFTCSDPLLASGQAGSGLADPCPSPVALTDNIDQILSLAPVSDQAGNDALPYFGPIRIDRASPITSATVPPDTGWPEPVNGWYRTLTSGEIAFNRTLRVALAASDTGGSGVQQLSYVVSGATTTCQPACSGIISGSSGTTITLGDVFTPDGETTITYHAVDTAGNVEPTQTLTVRVDNTPPTVTAQATSSGEPYLAGTWANQPVTVSFTCEDRPGTPGALVSGLAAPCSAIELQGEQYAGTISTAIADQAGNVTIVYFGPVRIDLTAPAVTVNATTGGQVYQPGTIATQPVSIAFTCIDPQLASGEAGSGVTTCPTSVTYDATVTGVMVPWMAADAAGNTVTGSFGPINVQIIELMLAPRVPTVSITPTVPGTAVTAIGTSTTITGVASITPSPGSSGATAPTILPTPSAAGEVPTGTAVVEVTPAASAAATTPATSPTPIILATPADSTPLPVASATPQPDGTPAPSPVPTPPASATTPTGTESPSAVATQSPDGAPTASVPTPASGETSAPVAAGSLAPVNVPVSEASPVLMP